MIALRKMVFAASCLVLLAEARPMPTPGWLKGRTDEKIKTLAEIQPGLGTVMLEDLFRFVTMYYAAKGGNWGLADYQLKEMREIQEVGETPSRRASRP